MLLFRFKQRIMRSTFFKLWVHCILHIAENSIVIHPELEPLLYLEIEKRFKEQGCEVVALNGMSDHIHILFSQNPLLTLHETIRFVQGVTQRWYQLHDFKTSWYKFKWQESYCAYSVGEPALDNTRFYIEKQQEIHVELNYWEEVDRLNVVHKVDMNDVVVDSDLQTWHNRYTFRHIGKEFL